MAVHVGELASQVDVTGATSPAEPSAQGAGGPAGWAERDRYRDLAEDEARRLARTSGGGFDG